MEQAHFTEELTLVQVGQDHLVTVFILDHHFDGTVDDVVEAVGQVARVNHHGLARYGAYATVGQKAVDCRNITQSLASNSHCSLSPINPFEPKS